MKYLAVLIAAVFAVLAVTTPAEAAYAMQFGKIQYDSPGSDNRSNSSLNAEWVTLRNTAGRTVVLTGWQLVDKVGHTYRFSTFSLRPHASVRIHTGHGSNTATDRYWNSGNYIWNNDGDSARLRDAAGHVIDQCSWKSGGSTNC